MKKFENLGFTTAVTNDKLKIEISISGLIAGFNGSPNNSFEQIKVKRGKRKEFAKYIAQKIIDEADSETGESYLMQMLESAFEDIFEGNDFNDEIFDYPYEGVEDRGNLI